MPNSCGNSSIRTSDWQSSAANTSDPGIGYWRKVELGRKRRGSRCLRLRETARTRSGWYCATLPWGEQKPAPQDMPVISVAFDAPLSHPAVIRSERLLGNGKKGEKGLLVPKKGTAEHNHL
jgi:hypothetical protein